MGYDDKRRESVGIKVSRFALIDPSVLITSSHTKQQQPTKIPHHTELQATIMKVIFGILAAAAGMASAASNAEPLKVGLHSFTANGNQYDGENHVSTPLSQHRHCRPIQPSDITPFADRRQAQRRQHLREALQLRHHLLRRGQRMCHRQLRVRRPGGLLQLQWWASCLPGYQCRWHPDHLRAVEAGMAIDSLKRLGQSLGSTINIQ